MFQQHPAQQKRVSKLNVRTDRKKFGYVLARRSKIDPMIKVGCTKPKNESLNIHLVRKKMDYEYIEVVFARELFKYGYNEWIQIQDIIDKHKGIHAQEVKLALQQLISKVNNSTTKIKCAFNTFNIFIQLPLSTCFIFVWSAFVIRNLNEVIM